VAKSQAAKTEESKKEVEAVANTEQIILNHVGFEWWLARYRCQSSTLWR